MRKSLNLLGGGGYIFPVKTRLGRTLTEMLAVLAIIGILSIAAVVGLQMAFVKNRANLIVNDVKLVGFILADGLLNQVPVGQSQEISQEIFRPESQLDFAVHRDNTETYRVDVSMVSSKVCDEVVKRSVAWVEAITANNRKGCRSDDSNVIEFYFNTFLDEQIQDEDRITSCEQDTDCGPDCGRCVNKVCYDDKSLCTGAAAYCVQGTCSECPMGQFSVNGVCTPCSSGTRPYTSFDECAKCNNRVYMFNQCWLCSQGKAIDNHSRCQCPAGQYFNLNSNGSIPRCAACGVGGQIVSAEADCLSCPEMFVSSAKSSCVNCSFLRENPSNVVETTRESCMNCSGTMWANGRCGRCNGILNADRTACQCADGFFFAKWISYYPVCISCDNSFTQGNTTAEECQRCPNRYINHYGNCVLCEGVVSSDGKSCDCSGENVFQAREQQCISCDTPDNFYSTAEQCARCQQRYYSDRGECILKPKCAAGEFILDNKCLPCPSPGVVSADGMVCKNACGSGELLSFGRSSDQALCEACDKIDYFRTTLEESLKCSHRFWALPYQNSRPCDGVVSSDGKSCDCSGDELINAYDFGCLSCAHAFWERRVRTTVADCAKCSHTWYDGTYCHGCDSYAPTSINTKALCEGCGYTWALNSCS